MELKINKKKDNKLLDRQEIEFAVSHKTASTPTRLSVRDNLAAKLASKPELIVIPRLNTRYGAGESYGVAHIYKTEKQKLAIEPKHIIKRFEPKAVKEEEKAEEAAPVAEEKKEEAKPAEEAKTEEQATVAEPTEASNDSKRAEGEPEPSDSEAKKEEKPAEEAKLEEKKEDKKEEENTKTDE